MYTKNKFLKLAAVSLSVVLLATACKKDFFEVEDPNGIDSQIWNDAGAVDLFLNRSYDLIIPNWPTVGGIHTTSDETNSVSTAFLYGQLVENSVTDIGGSNSITNNRYFDIRRCNVAIDGLATSLLPASVKDPLLGQFYFLRAFVYFRLVSLYGGVPLILKAQDLTGEDLNVPRSKSSEVFAAIAKDLDSAAAKLPALWSGNNVGRITKATAMAFKGKALLYWASPQFNPNNDADRWAAAYQANKAAYDTGVAHGYILFPAYANIWVTEDHREVMLVRKLDAISVSPGRGTNNEYVTRPPSESNNGGGSNQPTWNLVQAYTNSEGLPITHPSANYDQVMFWQNRDPRLEASIAYNGSVWPLSGKAGRKQWSYTGVLDEQASKIVTGFYCEKITNPSITATQAQYNSNTGGGSGMDWIEMRFAEVIMNLAECANETNRLAEAKDLIRQIRVRAGIKQGSFDFGLDVATDAASMRTLILNERQVEFAMEGKRYWDLRRTRNLHLISARQSLKVTPKPPYYAGTGTVAGRIYLDKPDALGVRPRDTANLNNKAVYTAMFNVAIASLEGSNVISIPNTYYHYALPNFFNQATYTMEQTLGWSGGTFDPLK
ncbi:MAG: RagB/SusD family nutrient uptake outer membrane protein [Bacteroidetes bacterium]|uniref:RagB/SusD family nutrient uptake outer membrane protein n=1 Tax=Phnomibacter sp. TaxID=2836217 RepID=UPI002FDD71E2|nr:RagB/SusD family nutrient uptake outer membrane protein [Bacteroidota bacterium]